MAKKYDLSKIMKQAWASYKGLNNKRTFSECLKSAWAVAKMQAGYEEKVRKGCYSDICGHLLYMAPEWNVCDTGHNGWVISGKTYEVRAELKRMGFRWDSECRYWYTEDHTVAYLFAAA